MADNAFRMILEDSLIINLDEIKDLKGFYFYLLFLQNCGFQNSKDQPSDRKLKSDTVVARSKIMRFA